MRWEIRNEEGRAYASSTTEGEAWMRFFHMSGKCFSVWALITCVKMWKEIGFSAVQVPA
jgi:hypothetical protein